MLTVCQSPIIIYLTALKLLCLRACCVGFTVEPSTVLTLFCVPIKSYALKYSQEFPSFLFSFFFKRADTQSRKRIVRKSAHCCIYKVVVHRHFQCKQASSLSKLGKGRHIYMYVWPRPLIYFMGMKHYGFPVDVLIEGVNHCKCTFYGFSIQTRKTLKSHNFNSGA